MIKITGLGLIAAAAMFITAGAFAEDKAGDKACCAKGASNKEKVACADLASLSLTADQKTKIEAWQAECVKDGCTKESRKTFLKQAKGILSADQFAKLKEQCKGEGKDKRDKTQT
jgi:hypothetical protein